MNHYPVNREVEITVRFKLKLDSIVNHFPLNKQEIEDETVQAMLGLENWIDNKLCGEHQMQDLTQTTDFWNFTINK